VLPRAWHTIGTDLFTINYNIFILGGSHVTLTSLLCGSSILGELEFGDVGFCGKQDKVENNSRSIDNEVETS